MKINHLHTRVDLFLKIHSNYLYFLQENTVLEAVLQEIVKEDIFAGAAGTGLILMQPMRNQAASAPRAFIVLQVSSYNCS